MTRAGAQAEAFTKQFDTMAAEALIGDAQALAPLVEEHRVALARDADLPPAIAEFLKCKGFGQLWLPPSLGGPELSPADCIRVVEALAKIDGTAAWCAASATNGSRLIGFLPHEGRDGMHGRGALSGSDKPNGMAVRDGAGWRVSGNWFFASFVSHSDFVGAPCFEQEDGRMKYGPDGAPIIRMAIVPTDQVQVTPSWQATGLIASGSHEFAFKDLWVPDARMIEFARFFGAPVESGPLYRLPFLAAFEIGHVGVPLGIAAGAIEAFCILAQDKTPTLTTTLLRDQAEAHRAVAHATALLRSARAFVFTEVQSLWDTISSGSHPTTLQRASLRAAVCHAGVTAKQVVNLMYTQSGSTAVTGASRLGAYLRDAWAVAQHVNFVDRLMEPLGRLMLGLEPENDMF
jgi:indole-3-acetate monooxygenase